ncbi:RNA polymerase sigma-70 factor [Olivibacter sp. XZL3]|uniref:RNA polymerase sigma-70 factor n=1 Tax=Olivibacter sp. XZL3 TaxID=1735116 RepID=UPI001416F9FC|nr:RNA polymerase sigma-70 factor [Olivibacter sp. XZL3]
MDTSMITAIRAGNPKAFKVFYDLLKQDVYAYAYRFFRSSELAQEAVQDVFMQVWKYRENIDPEQNLKAYVYRIARNSIYNKLKQIAHQGRYASHVFYSQAASHNDLEDWIHCKELREIYEEAINKLPTQRQLIFKLSRIEFLSHEEIADQLCISKNTVKDQIVKSLKFIKHYMYTHAELTTSLVAFVLFVAGF